jgi:cysteine-rich repeat protein
MARLRLVLLLALAAPAAACSVIVDGALHDSTPTSPCQGLDDGTPCDRAGIAAALICRGGICGNSRCGDGVLDARTEQCDDGDLLDGNGCETDCTVSPTCGGPGDCPDPGITCLEATCDGSSCGVGPSPDNTPCTTDGGASGVCFTGSCVGTTCGDGTLDTDEVCDDGNEVFGDGCYGCLPDCIDASTCFQDPCLGAQECQTSTADNGGLIGVCVATTSPVDCGNPDCSVCDPATGGCIPSFTADMDGDLPGSRAAQLPQRRIPP